MCFILYNAHLRAGLNSAHLYSVLACICKGVDKGGGGLGWLKPPPILAAKINYLKMQETHFIADAIFRVMTWVSGVAPPVEKKLSTLMICN